MLAEKQRKQFEARRKRAAARMSKKMKEFNGKKRTQKEILSMNRSIKTFNITMLKIDKYLNQQ